MSNLPSGPSQPLYNGIAAANGLPATLNSTDTGSNLVGGNYWDSAHGVNENLTNINPGLTDSTNKYGTVMAFNDPNSDISQSLQYGGSSGYAAQAEAADQALGAAAMGRSAPQLNTTNISQDNGQLGGLANQLSSVANGSTNTPAQQQLANTYAQNNAGMSSQVAGSGGGSANGAAARQAASQAQQAAALNQSQQSNLLSANEAASARTNLGAVNNTMYNNANNVAMTNATLAQNQGTLNSNFQANQDKRALTTAGNALSANETWQGNIATAEGNANNFSDQSNQIYQNGAQATTKTILGGIQGGITAAAGIANASGGSQNPTAGNTIKSGLAGAVAGGNS